jgi:zinc transport system substrate-binding protein
MKQKFFLFCVLVTLLGTASFSAANTACKLTIGVSLHPYYSWVTNIVGDAATVVPLIPIDADPHYYQPLPADMERLAALDVVVINGIGHDEFVVPMLKAIDNEKLEIIDTSKGLPLIPSFGKHYTEGNSDKISYNSHTYIAITGAIQQIQMIARTLGRLCPDQAPNFIKNSQAYSARLRNMLHATLIQIEPLNVENLRIATVHDGYSYLLQELGLEVSAVVQPRHGIKPSPRQLQDTIKRINAAKVNVLFGELDYEKKYVDIIYEETGCRLSYLSHISHGEYTPEHFEENIRENMNSIVRALREVNEGQGMPQKIMEENMSRQMEATARKMQESIKENLQKAIPEAQSKQMQESMSRQMEETARKIQEGMQENLQKALPTQQQIKERTEKMQEDVQRQLSEEAKD